MKMNKRQKTAASAGLAVAAVTAVLGGTLAQFTDQDTTSDQTLTAGTVNVGLTEGANWDTAGLILAVDDTVDRSVVVSNDGNLNIKSVVLSADVADTGATTAALSEGVRVTVSQDGTALVSDVKLADFTDQNLTLAAGGLAPGDDATLTFSYEVVASELGTEGGARDDFAANPDNAFQGTSTTVDYTVDAIQRDGAAL